MLLQVLRTLTCQFLTRDYMDTSYSTRPTYYIGMADKIWNDTAGHAKGFPILDTAQSQPTLNHPTRVPCHNDRKPSDPCIAE
jgi:hypothetical protein